MRKLLVYADLHWLHKSVSRAERSRSSPTVGRWHKRFDRENARSGTLLVFVSAWLLYSVRVVIPFNSYYESVKRCVLCII